MSLLIPWAFFFGSFCGQFVAAHYIFSVLITNLGTSTSAVRRPADNSPVHDITSPGATCNVGLIDATETVSVAAGSLIGFKLLPGTTVFHKGPAAMYLGEAPGGIKAAYWDGGGQNWFKIAEWGATFNPFNFVSLGKDTFTTIIPSSVPSGEYLVRIEQIGLHVTGSPELFVSCAQIKITGGGASSPSKVSIPGYIAKDDPMLMINIYYPVPTAYTVPGPPIYQSLSYDSYPSYDADPTESKSEIVRQPSEVQPYAVRAPAVPANQTLPLYRLGRQRRSSSVHHIRRQF